MHYILTRHLGGAMTAFFLTYMMVPIMMGIARRWHILDIPDNKLKVHAKPTPYLGGVAVYFGIVGALALFYPVYNSIMWFLLGATLLLFVGLIDDLRALRPAQKFAGQLLVTTIFVVGLRDLDHNFLYLLFMHFFPSDFLAMGVFISLVATAFWILSIINACNLIDVMDGLVATQAVLIFCCLLFVALLMGNYEVSLLVSIGAASVAAFFWYNRPPAQIYLGDAGSLFIGGFLSIIPFFIQWDRWNPWGILAPLLPFMVLATEVMALIIIRLQLGIPFYHGSPHHFATYLRRKGYSAQHVLCSSGLFTLLFSVIALFAVVYTMPWWAIIFAALLCWAGWLFIVFSPGQC